MRWSEHTRLLVEPLSRLSNTLHYEYKKLLKSAPPFGPYLTGSVMLGPTAQLWLRANRLPDNRMATFASSMNTAALGGCSQSKALPTTGAPEQTVLTKVLLATYASRTDVTSSGA